MTTEGGRNREWESDRRSHPVVDVHRCSGWSSARDCGDRSRFNQPGCTKASCDEVSNAVAQRVENKLEHVFGNAVDSVVGEAMQRSVESAVRRTLDRRFDDLEQKLSKRNMELSSPSSPSNTCSRMESNRPERDPLADKEHRPERAPLADKEHTRQAKFDNVVVKPPEPQMINVVPPTDLPSAMPS
eukprot:gnl/TRDRNA2_/TRDRNA2_106592_c1_seq1.p1 gnl/TRDRNA2_/TRDRNA2_106592_c1~~gnl/TRDRNA2_/TRDRNA2_106592_c1_seq1.p1  ORF type:complete len:215 (+),score=30.47 gnl/TRDRNA2_/TRDRNA2_106592_c1_seq1:88-645(+)